MRTGRRGQPKAYAALAGAGALVLAGALGACSATRPSATPTTPAGPGDGIGAWPTFLPSPTPQGVATGSLDAPAMSYPGSPVLVRVGTAEALMDVEGPSYPADTEVGAEEARCTFTVTISRVSGPISMKHASFSVLDGQGGLHQLVVSGGRHPPDRLVPGDDVTLALVGTLPAGEGLLRYYPTTEGAVAAWDYVAETD